MAEESRVEIMDTKQNHQFDSDDKAECLSRLNIEFTPEEAKKALVALIDEKINQYKIYHWKAWERDHSVSRKVIDSKIQALKKQKEALLALDHRKKDLILKLKGEIIMESIA